MHTEQKPIHIIQRMEWEWTRCLEQSGSQADLCAMEWISGDNKQCRDARTCKHPPLVIFCDVACGATGEQLLGPVLLVQDFFRPDLQHLNTPHTHDQ